MVAAVTFVATGGNFQLAMMAYSFTSTAIDAYNAGLSPGRALALATASAVASYIGSEIGSAFGEAIGGGSGTAGGAFWGSVFGGAGAGAAGGAAGAAVVGGDIGRAAYQGAAIGAGMGAVDGIFKANAIARQSKAQAQETTNKNIELALNVDKPTDALRPLSMAETGTQIGGFTSPAVYPSITGKLAKARLLLYILWALIGKGKPPQRPDPIAYDNSRSGWSDTYDPPK